MAMLDPVRLAGLKQATYAIQCLTKGQSRQEITMALGGGERLVTIWISFLKQNHSITETKEKWSTVAKGKVWSSEKNGR